MEMDLLLEKIAMTATPLSPHKKPIASSLCPSIDCMQILDDGFSTGNGYYWIDQRARKHLKSTAT